MLYFALLLLVNWHFFLNHNYKNINRVSKLCSRSLTAVVASDVFHAVVFVGRRKIMIPRRFDGSS